MPKKNYVFDTNVLIHDPTSIFRFQDNDIYIPIYVLEEIDGLKNDHGERGRAAREATRILDDFRVRGSLIDGIKIHDDEEIQNSGYLRIYTPTEYAKLPVATDNKIDHCILQSSLDIKKKSENRTILVTMDINLRVRAEAMNLQVAPYEFQSVDISNLGNKVITIDLTPNEFQDFYKSGEIDFEEDSIELNTSVLLTCNGDVKKTALGRVKGFGNNKVIRKLNLPKHLMGVKPRNMEQQFAMDLLLDDDIKLVTIMGKAGCGKTLLSISAGLYQVLGDNKIYDKLLISRPAVEMGKGVGFLPGDINEKMAPYMQPFYDNLDYIMMSSGSKREYGTLDDLFENGIIQVEPLTFIRGRSIPNQFMIVDECQNLTPHEIKTIITRCGTNTKIILTGDVHQIDNPYISATSNGLSVAAKKLKNNPIVGSIELEKGERSPLANLAAEKM